ncbi:hypothetical protein DE146DRAFT_129374 [Phaeosphaeria sp. MPI-PUGE-AT-0046c]|nr:hypothetical protein DE146DRAFT_129374 [Phaeosphaeria sp. MPI-PUGE-AT-0046c]
MMMLLVIGLQMMCFFDEEDCNSKCLPEQQDIAKSRQPFPRTFVSSRRPLSLIPTRRSLQSTSHPSLQNPSGRPEASTAAPILPDPFFWPRPSPVPQACPTISSALPLSSHLHHKPFFKGALSATHVEATRSLQTASSLIVVRSTRSILTPVHRHHVLVPDLVPETRCTPSLAAIIVSTPSVAQPPKIHDISLRRLSAASTCVYCYDVIGEV